MSVFIPVLCRFLFVVALFAFTLPAAAEVPNILNYQGKIAANGTNFNGSGRFKFALVTAEGAVTVWSNDGTSVDGSQPSSFVSLPVTNGNFSVLLGDTSNANMIAVNPGIFGNSDIRLRVWFNDGINGFQLLTPDQRLAAVGYSLASVSAATATSATTASSVFRHATAPAVASAGNAGTVYLNSTDQKLHYSDGTTWKSLATAAPSYRWAVWNNYDNAGGSWFFSNTNAFTGGVTPSTWADGLGTAAQISSNKQVQATLFNKRAAISPNSLVWAETYLSYSSTDAKMIGALFRVRNTTPSPINWTLSFHGTSYGPWGEMLSVAVNGANTYTQNGNNTPSSSYSVSLSIPPNRTSTVICIAGSAPPIAITSGISSRSAVLAFRNNCLSLPAGLEFVDDLDTATGGYEQ